MTQGIYITADDNMIREVVALFNSLSECAYPIAVMPYSINCSKLKTICDSYGHRLLNASTVFSRAARIHNTLNNLLYGLCEWRGRHNVSYATHLGGNFSRFVLFEELDELPFDSFLWLDADVVVRDPAFIKRGFEALESHTFVSLDHMHKMPPSCHRLVRPEYQPVGHKNKNLFCVGAFFSKKTPEFSNALQTAMLKLHDPHSELSRCLMTDSPEQTVLECLMCCWNGAHVRHLYGDENYNTYATTALERMYPPSAMADFVHFMSYDVKNFVVVTNPFLKELFMLYYLKNEM